MADQVPTLSTALQQHLTIFRVVANKMFAMQDVLVALTMREEDIAKQRDETINEIRRLVQSIVESVQQGGQQLVEEVNKIAEGKLQLLGQQKEEAEKALVQLKRCKEFVDKGLEVDSPQEKESLIEDMEGVSKGIDPATFQPVEEPNITFTQNEKALENFNCKSIGTVKCSFSPRNIKGNVTTSASPMVGSDITGTLSLQTKLGSPCTIPLPLTCHLVSPDSSQAIVCDIKETESVGKYAFSFTPSANGKHDMKIQVEGIDIDGSPFSIHVEPSLEISKPVKTISGLTSPCGVAVDKNGQLIVAKRSAPCINVYDKEGREVQSFGSRGKQEGQFSLPYGVAVTNDDHILVTDEHRLHKFTPDGRYITSVGRRAGGSEPLQFSYASGIAVYPTTGQIYVADCFNHRIQVINDDFTYSHSIGSEGKAPGQLNSPQDVALDGTGNVYVASNHCVDVFTSDGKHLRRFGSKGSGDGQLKKPSSLTLDANNLVYVAEYGNSRVSVFTTDGQFIRCIGREGDGEGEFIHPQGITIDTSGNLCVSDYGNSRVVVF